MIALVEPLLPAENAEYRYTGYQNDTILYYMLQSRNTTDSNRSAFPLSDAELGAVLLHALDTRERIILELMGFSGLRLTEVCALEIARLDLKGRTVQVVGKGDKVRTVPIPGGTADKLKVFVGKRTRGYVFEGRKGAPHISPRMVQYMVSQAGARVGFKQRAPTLTQLNPHTLRHTAARRMKEHGFDFEEIARMLGHDDIAKTVMMYGTKTFKEIQAKADKNLFNL